MKKIFAMIIVLSDVSAANAQPAPPYAAPDEVTWSQMVKALDGVPASGEAHQQISGILQQVQQIAGQRKMQADAQAAAAKKAADEAALKNAGTAKSTKDIETPKK